MNHPFYQDLLTAMMIAGVCVAIKRYWLGLYMGKRTYLRWASELGKVMEKAVLIRDVANLSRMKVKKMGIPTDLGDDVLLDTSSVDEQSQASKTKEGWLGSHLTGYGSCSGCILMNLTYLHWKRNVAHTWIP